MVEVVAALIISEDTRRFLLCQRPAHKARGGLWEFVGGKVEPGETRAQAIVRECREELGVTIEPGEEMLSVLHEYPDVTIRLTLIASRIVSGSITLLEHQDARFVGAGELGQLALCPADQEIVDIIRDRLPGA